MSVAWDEISKLLNIANLAHQWANLRPIHDAALRELTKHAEVAAKDNAEAKRIKDAKAAQIEAKRKEEMTRQAKIANPVDTKPVEPEAEPTRPAIFPHTYADSEPVTRRTPTE